MHGPHGSPPGARRRSVFEATAIGLERVIPFVQRQARRVRKLALFALAGAAAIWWGLFDRLGGSGRSLSLVLWAAVLLAAPAFLLGISLTLRLLVTLPDRIRALPDRARQRTAELGRLAVDARRARQRGGLRSCIALIRLWRRASASREVVDLATPAAFLFSPWTVVAALFAVVAAVAEVIGGACVLLWLVLT